MSRWLVTGGAGYIGAHVARRLVESGREVVVLDAHGTPRFELLQKGHDTDAILVAFDLLRLDGADLRRRPIEERKRRLANLAGMWPCGRTHYFCAVSATPT